MALDDQRISGNFFETLSKWWEIFTLENRTLIPFYQCQTDTKDDLGAFIEQAIPYPQDSLKYRENIYIIFKGLTMVTTKFAIFCDVPCSLVDNYQYLVYY